MSTLKVSAINNEAAGSGGLTFSATGNVTGAGMDLIVTQTFSAVSSVSVNNCFTTDYDAYYIYVTFTASVGVDSRCTLRLRAAGTDSTASYENVRHVFWSAPNTTVSANLTGTDDWFAGDIDATYAGTAFTRIFIKAPALAEITAFMLDNWQKASTALMYGTNVYGQHNVSSAYDGFTLATSGTSFTGTIRVYGYRN